MGSLMQNMCHTKQVGSANLAKAIIAAFPALQSDGKLGYVRISVLWLFT